MNVKLYAPKSPAKITVIGDTDILLGKDLHRSSWILTSRKI